MFHFFHGTLQRSSALTLLKNDLFGIQVSYAGKQTTGDFFLYPHLDDTKKTVFYFAFDTPAQKQLFESLLKISGIWTKTAFTIAQYEESELKKAIETMDVKFFQAIPGIWPKSAKKILLELKGTIDFKQISSMEGEQKLLKDIVKSLKNFGYEAEAVKAVLTKYPEKIRKENMSEVIKWAISHL